MRVDFKHAHGRNDVHLVETATARKMHDDLLAQMPGDAAHDESTCPFCLDQASQTENPPSVIPPADGGSDVSEDPNTKGGNTPMTDISQETHEALLRKAVEDATKALDSALQQKTEQLDAANATIETLTQEKDELANENQRVNGELDAAQVELRSAQDKVGELETAAAKSEEDRAKADLASKRATQVKELKLFGDEYVDEKASSWAELDDVAWSDRVDEWAKLKPTTNSEEPPAGDSAMSGSNGDQQDQAAASGGSDKPSRASRAVLGLS